MQAMQHNGHGARAGCAIVALLCGAALADTPAARQTSTWPSRAMAFNVTLGVQQWPALSDLRTQPYGTFDDIGLNLSASAHVMWKQTAHSDLMLGLDLGLMGHESDITPPGDFGDLSASVLYLAPSLRWSYRDMRFMRLNLEAGVGVYGAEIKEFINTDFGSLEGTEHFEKWAPGGYVGISFDVPVGRSGRWSINTGARVHYADFGSVGAFGRDLGTLDGPITTWQLGMNRDFGGI